MSAYSSTPLIEARQISRIDQSTQRTLLTPTDFALLPGAQVAITGTSGSGKSVLLRTLSLLDAPDSGQLLWHGQPIGKDKVPHYRSNVCYLAQRPALIEGSVLDNLMLAFTLKSLRARTFSIQVARELFAKVGKDADFLDKNAGDLSGGEAQVVALIRSLQLDPQVMLLDEPTSALDPQSAALVETLVDYWFNAAPQMRAFIWISHDLLQTQRMGKLHLTMADGVLQTEPKP